MDDRELLELAAKAAGMEVWTDIDGNLYTSMQDLIEKSWNPLTDDGDALRLAVKIGMGVLYETQEFMGGRVVEVSYNIDEDEGTCKVVTERLGDDPYAATRRAIVRAAAETARQEKDHDR